MKQYQKEVSFTVDGRRFRAVHNLDHSNFEGNSVTFYQGDTCVGGMFEPATVDQIIDWWIENFLTPVDSD